MEKLETIFIVDDDEIYQLFTQKSILRLNKDLSIFSFVNGRDAIQRLQQNLESNQALPDLILLDINMPVMDGWQFMDAYLSLKQSIPKEITIYIVSSSIAPSDKDKAASYPAIAGFISKPLNLEVLEKLIHFKLV
jgi:CheY-like chemotaxis protein